MGGKLRRPAALLLAAATFLGVTAVCGTSAKAQTATLDDVAQRLGEVEQATDAAALAGHNAWMLTSAALVLFMTAPGLA
ncbi:MAG: ammonium transporter, partial [Planctomycetales bacterium]|nr:ammonium transporter [Planctomycetales bacterium]